MFTISFTDSAIEDMRPLSKAAQVMIFDSAEKQLSQEPLTATRHRKPLRPNDLSKWEVRVREYRIFYDVDEKENRVTVNAVGIKRGNALFIRGKEYRL
jgi:mRNA-degrading endonuclease RelE of RelBE toxin-antitoxin system